MSNFRISALSQRTIKTLSSSVVCAGIFLLSACGSSVSPDAKKADADEPPKTFAVQVGSDLNTQSSPLLSLNPGGPGGSPNQSLRAGDILQGSDADDLLIGGLGVDILFGEAGDDILIGGTEDFNSSVDGDDKGADNRDRAFGHSGDDVFVWSPGDGSDYFDGGEGTDVIIFGILGEQRDADGGTDGAPFFNVNPSGVGSRDFDGIFTDDYGLPQVRVSNTPGFCSLVDTQTYANELSELGLDQIIRFSLRTIANAFDSGDQITDDGLRVAISLKNTEYVVCTHRDFDEAGGVANIEVLDVSSGTPVAVNLSDLPVHVQALIK